MLRFSVLHFELGHSCSTKLNSDTESKVSLQRALSLHAVLSQKWTLELNINLHVVSLSVNIYIFIIPLC